MGNSFYFLCSRQRLFGFLSKAALRRIGVFLVVITLAVQAARAADHLAISNPPVAHDPSSLIYDGNNYYFFSTNGYIPVRYSSNLFSANPATFSDANPNKVFNSSTLPAWTIPFTTDANGQHKGGLWAPDIAYFNNEYHLYYSASAVGHQDSAIGMATSPSLSSPVWTDHGIVIQSYNGSAYNTIDPSIFQNSDGNLWMTYGSYWNGIYKVQLNPTSGMLLTPSNPNPVQLASQGGGPIEGSAMYRRGDYYYLFVNLGVWMTDTYKICMGRSTSINGPFTDQSSVSMLNSGGTLLQGTEGIYAGPGHFEGISHNGQDYFSYHYYNNGNSGDPRLGIDYLYWTNDAWPTTTAPEPIWCGAGAYTGNANNSNNNWSTPNNWGGKTPTPGTNELKFGALVAGGYTVCQNDAAGTAQYNAIRFLSSTAPLNTPSYTLQGTGIRLVGPIVNASNNDQIINLDIILYTNAGSIDTGAKKITIGGVLSETGGARSLFKTGSGELILKANSTYTGATNINQGTLTIDGGDLADASTINVAGGATLQVINGTPGLGDIAGLGSTSVSGTGTVLTVNSIAQNTLTIGSGAMVIINAIPGGPLRINTIRAVPEPGTFIMLLIAATAAIIAKRKSAG